MRAFNVYFWLAEAKVVKKSWVSPPPSAAAFAQHLANILRKIEITSGFERF